MTPAQRRVLDAFVELLARDRVPPTMQRLADHLGLSGSSRGAVHARMQALVHRGYLKAVRGKHYTEYRLTPLAMRVRDSGVDIGIFNDAALIAELERRGYALAGGPN